MEHIPYYQQKVKTQNPSVTDIPFVDKSILLNTGLSAFMDSSRKIYFTDYTSGSSGIQGKFHSDRAAYSIAVAIQMLWWQWAGYEYGNPLLQLGMTTKRGLKKKLKDIFFHVNYQQAFHIEKDRVVDTLIHLRRKKAHFFMGYASALYEYARIAKEAGIDDIKLKSVVSWGDKMFPHYRRIIEKQFHTEVFDTYGANENTMIAAECEYHNYHIMTPHIYLELLDNQGNEVKPGQIGHVVVTRLDNYLMPLIRYQIGDLAVKADPEKKCPCGRGFPLLEKIIGRDTDIVYTKGGKSLIVHFFTGIFEYVEQIRQFQVIQHSLEDIEIRFIPSENFSDHILESIQQDMYKKANERFPVRFTITDSILPTPSGKPQIVISHLNIKKPECESVS
ncbi:phenylacetate--CoA ligase family protein [bacterium]|nr:phenylacetate--CoA ligase family protein [bacterium]